MNFTDPLSALFPGASSRIVTALTAHRASDPQEPLDPEELARRASVAVTQLESALFRLGLLGLLRPRRRGEPVHVVPGHIVWKALEGITDLTWRVAEEVRSRCERGLDPPPAYLALAGSVAEGTAAHPADLLELVVVPPEDGPADWRSGLDRLVAQLCVDLGNHVVVREAARLEEAAALAGVDAVVVTD